MPLLKAALYIQFRFSCTFPVLWDYILLPYLYIMALGLSSILRSYLNLIYIVFKIKISNINSRASIFCFVFWCKPFSFQKNTAFHFNAFQKFETLYFTCWCISAAQYQLVETCMIQGGFIGLKLNNYLISPWWKKPNWPATTIYFQYL